MVAKILLVDDEQSIHRLICRIFEKKDYSLISAYNGEEAIQKAKEENPDLILLDINMPKMDGYEVMRELRKEKSMRNIPVMMLTGNGEIVDKSIGYELGVEDYVSKPFKVQDFVTHVENFI